MSLNYTVTKVEEFQMLPEGKYTARVNNVEEGINDHGVYIDVSWSIIGPAPHEGRSHKERYLIESSIDIVKTIAVNNFSKFCQVIGELKEGDKAKVENFLYKVATIFIRHRTGKKDGVVRANIQSMELGESNFVQQSPNKALSALVEKETGIVIPSKPIASGAILNDDVPF